tara:strand:- start:204 stop:563 length:360 start_codon:yes stop_codon:yes gene_type:complete
MAAISLSGVTSFPSGTAHTCDTVWQEFVLDPLARTVTVENRDAAIVLRVAWDTMGPPASAETPADNGAVGTHFSQVPASGSRVYRVREDAVRRNDTGSIFVAGASGAPVCYVEMAKGAA